MFLSPFSERFPETADPGMFVLRIQDPGLPLPPGTYEFTESFCTERSCDCRRVLIQVLSPEFPGRILATINYGWESEAFYSQKFPGDKTAGREITGASLDPINPQSELADALLSAFRDFLRRDADYPQRLKHRYEQFKNTPPPTCPVRAADSSWTVPEILDQLRTIPEQTEFAPYEDALLAAIDQREAIVPELIAAIERVCADPDVYLKRPDENLHLFAIYLLAQFRELRALESFLRFFSLPGETSLNLTGDMVTENGGAVLASVCGGDPDPLLRLIHDEAVNEFVRGQAIAGLLVQAVWRERGRAQVIEDLRRLFHTLPKPGDGAIWAALVCAVCDFQAVELLPEARQAFAEELVDEGIIGPEELDEIEPLDEDFLTLGDSRYGLFCERYQPIHAIAECSGWICFRDDEDYSWMDDEKDDVDALEDILPPRLLGDYDDPPPQPYIAPPKVGRNEPCPCGSGRKYKKCCGG